MTGIFTLLNIRHQLIEPCILAIPLEYIVHMMTILCGFSIAMMGIWQRIIILPIMFNSLTWELLIRFQIFLYLRRCWWTLLNYIWLNIFYYIFLVV